MISILTPTYNRAYILPQLYESLKNQSLKEFEWIVVDDGSTDNTKEIIEKWINETDIFKITYLKQNNGGKHRAINKGVPFAKYKYVYILDSDDYLTSDAVENIQIWLTSIHDREDFAGVSGLKGIKSKTNIIGEFPKELDYIDATNIERKQKNLLGDKAEVLRKDLLIRFPFPEFEGENFLSEIAVWNKIALEGYKIRWFNKVICICEYLEDGLTKSNSEVRNLNNFLGYTYVEKMNVKLNPFLHSKFAIGRFFFLARKKGLSSKEIRKILQINSINFYLGIFFEIIKRGIKSVR